MSSKRWLVFCAAGLFALSGHAALAVQGNGNGHYKHGDQDDDDRGKGKDKYKDKGKYKYKYKNKDRDHYGYDDRDRDEMRAWYFDHRDNLPPGLAKRDRLPPGLEKQLVTRGTLPPGLRKKMQPCPEELEMRLPPPPPDCRHVFIGGSLVLVNVRSFAIVDVFHFEVH